MLKPQDFVHALTNEEFGGRFPEVVTGLHGSQSGTMRMTVRVSARRGDRDYEKVLKSWMLQQGYVLKSKLRK